jgi:hypothetical protein
MDRIGLQQTVLALVLSLSAAANVAAQNADRAQSRVLFADTIAELKTTQGPARVSVATGDVDSINFIVTHALPEMRAELVALLENQRVGKQVGAPVLPSGTTSLVAKGDTPSVLGFALEHGLVTGTKTRNNVTLRGNLVGLIEGAARGIGVTASDRLETRLLRKLSFSASFEPTTAGAAADDGIDDADRLSAWSARLDLLNRRHAQDRFHRTAWGTFVRSAGQALSDATNQAKIALDGDPQYREWSRATAVAINAATNETVEEVFLDRLAVFRGLTLAPQTRTAFARAAVAYVSYLKQRQELLDGIARAAVVSVEYTNSRTRDLPYTSNFRLIADGSIIGGSVTGNFALTLFDGDKPPGAGSIRDVQGAFQYDVTLKSANPTAPPVLLSLALKGQWLAEDVMLKEALFPDTKGTVLTGQLKVTVPIGDSPIRLPISVTYGNRSELIKEKLVRGQVGLTFDVDALLAGAGLRR